MSTAQDPAQLLRRARALTEDLNLTTLGWRIPSERVIEDLARHEHGLRADEHELVDITAGEAARVRRAFSLFAPDGVQLVALLLEQDKVWTLLVPDRSTGPS